MIPPREIRFTYTTSSKPGGQNVNKVETRVTLHFDIESSASLSQEEKALIRERLPGRINRQGILRVSSQKFRTREANRKAAVKRFGELLSSALAVRRARKKTRIPRSVKKKRLSDKRHRSSVKKTRRIKGAEDD